VAQRDAPGRSLKATLTAQEYKRLDALFQTKALVNEMAQAQRLLEKFVKDARKHGATWVEIGNAIGVTAQAACSRWSPTSEEATRRRASTGGRPKQIPRATTRREVQQTLAV